MSKIRKRTNPRKETSLGESLAGSHADNPIRNSWRDFFARKVSPRVSPRVSDRIISMTPGETLSETRFFTQEIYLYVQTKAYRIYLYTPFILGWSKITCDTFSYIEDNDPPQSCLINGSVCIINVQDSILIFSWVLIEYLLLHYFEFDLPQPISIVGRKCFNEWKILVPKKNLWLGFCPDFNR